MKQKIIIKQLTFCERRVDLHDTSMGQRKIWVPMRNRPHDLPNTGRALYPQSYENSVCPMPLSCRLTHLSTLLPSTKFTIFIHLSQLTFCYDQRLQIWSSLVTCNLWCYHQTEHLCSPAVHWTIFSLAYYYEIYLLPIFVVLLSSKSWMLSK